MNSMANRLLSAALFIIIITLNAVAAQGAILYVAPAPKAAAPAPAVPAQIPNFSPIPAADGGGAPMSASGFSSPTSPLSGRSGNSSQGLQLQGEPVGGSSRQPGATEPLQSGLTSTQRVEKQSAGQQSGQQSLQSGEPAKSEIATGMLTDVRKSEIAAALDMSAIEKNFGASLDTDQKTAPQKFAPGAFTQFGYSFFRPEGFAPQTDVPVGDDYIVGPGDSIVLTVWGSLDSTYTLVVNRSGEVTLPSIGTFKVAGASFGTLPDIFRANIGKVYKDFKLSVNIGRLRQIKVYLVGEVRSPGDYNISSMGTVINALASAGGPTRNGSLRTIKIKRNGQTVDSVDLYDFFLNGDKSRDIRLQGGDTILVPAIGPVAGITGSIRRPAIYETKGVTTLKGLIDLAGGLLPTTYLQRIQIIRIQANEKVFVLDRNIDPRDTGKSMNDLLDGIGVNDQDLVKIFPIDRTTRGYVRLNGYVLRPGDYALTPDLRVADLLNQDNLLPEYYTRYGQIVRLIAPDFHPEVINFNVNEALAGKQDQNHKLQEFDEIRIFNRWELEEMPIVRISGEVKNPGTYRLLQNMTLRDLLINAGNPRQTAYLNSADLTRLSFKDGKVTSVPLSVDLARAIAGDPKANIPLQNFDELLVHKIPSWVEATDRYITLSGEFRFPGRYPIFKGERLSSAIKRAGGFTERAYLRAAKFTRESVRESQQKRMDEFAITAEQEVTRKSAELANTAFSQEELMSIKASLDGVKQNLQVLKQLRAEGRIVTRLTDLDSFAGSPYDVELMPGDILAVLQSSNAVSVLGRVVNPTNFISLDDSSVKDYLQLAGGVSRDSEEDELYVVRADGSIFSRQQYSSMASLFGGGFMSERLEAGDTIIVPQRYERTAWMRTVKDITTIMSQIAITAGTVILGLR